VGSFNGVEGSPQSMLSNSMATTPLRTDIARVLMLSDEDRGIVSQVGRLFGVSEARKRYNSFLYPKNFQNFSVHKERTVRKSVHRSLKLR
jgi:hypothetical protein